MGGSIRGIIAGGTVLVAGVLGSAAVSAQEPGVAAAQTVLREERLYTGEITGVWDKRTEAALRWYQITHSLRVTGRLDPATRAALQPPVATPPPQIDEADRAFLRQLPPEPVAENPRAGTPPPPGEDAGGSRAPLSREAVLRFVESFLRAASEPDSGEELRYFGARVDYFDRGSLNAEQLREAMQKARAERVPRAFELLDLEPVIRAGAAAVSIRFTVRTTGGTRMSAIEKREAVIEAEAGGGLRFITLREP